VGESEAEGEIGGTVLSRNGQVAARFAFEDRLRPGAQDALARLRAQGFGVEIVSGDAPAEVARVAAGLDVRTFAGGMLPREKVGRIDELAAAGRKVLMVGDGLNDSAALLAAHVSIAPAS